MKTCSLTDTTTRISGGAVAPQIFAFGRPLSRGRVAFIMSFAITLLIGAMALGTDVGLLYLKLAQ